MTNPGGALVSLVQYFMDHYSNEELELEEEELNVLEDDDAVADDDNVDYDE